MLRLGLLLCLCFLSIGNIARASALNPTADELAAAKEAMRTTAQWLIEEHEGVPNGARRLITLELASGVESAVAYGPENNHAACRSLEFLALYAEYEADSSTLLEDGHTERHHVRLGIRRLVDRILGMRADAPSKIYHGAIRMGGTTRTYATMPNAACGHALLVASVVMDEPGWKDRAIDIARFLLRLQNPEPYYAGRVDLSGRSTSDGIFDAVYARPFNDVEYDDALQVNMNTWNLEAAPFLEEIFRETGVTGFHYGAIKIVRGLAYGALNNYNYYATGGLPDGHPLISKTFNSDCSPNPELGDGQWHHSADTCFEGDHATTGTDGIEYGLAALHAYGASPASGYGLQDLSDAYAFLVSMPILDDAGNTVHGFDTRKSFLSYFRMCISGTACRPYHFGSYYDAVGLGLLARFKRDLSPSDLDGVFSALLTGPLEIGTLADRNFQAAWQLQDDGTLRRTQGILPVAINATAILEILNDL